MHSQARPRYSAATCSTATRRQWPHSSQQPVQDGPFRGWRNARPVAHRKLFKFQFVECASRSSAAPGSQFVAVAQNSGHFRAGQAMRQLNQTHPAPAARLLRCKRSFVAASIELPLSALSGKFKYQCLRPSRGLTHRSSGAPTAGRQARSGGTRYIIASPGLASCRWLPLSSNVRQQR